MTVFLIIIALALLLQIAAKTGINPHKNFKDNLRAAAGVSFIFTGVTHFLMPEKYLEMMPPVFPAPVFLIYLSGVLEILGGAGLIVARTKRLAATGLILLLLAVFPANIYVAVNNVPLGGFMSLALYQWLRLPMQFALIALVYWSGEINQLWRKKNES